MLVQQKVCLGSTKPPGCAIILVIDLPLRVQLGLRTYGFYTVSGPAEVAGLPDDTRSPGSQQRGAILGAIVDSARSRAFCTFASRNGFLHGFKNASRNGFYHGIFFRATPRNDKIHGFHFVGS